MNLNELPDMSAALEEVKGYSKGGKVEFYNHCSISPERVVGLITEHTSYRLDGGEKLRLSKALPDSASRISEADFLLQFLENGLVS